MQTASAQGGQGADTGASSQSPRLLEYTLVWFSEVDAQSRERDAEEPADVKAALGTALLRLITPVREKGALLFEDVTWAAERLAMEGSLLVPGSEVAICSAGGPDRTFTVIAASPGAKSALAGSAWPRRGTIVQRALETQTAVESTDTQSLHLLGSVLADAGFQTVRAIPLPTTTGNGADRSEAGVYLALRRDGVGFSEIERRLIDAYTPLVALTLTNAEHRRAEANQARRWALGVDVALDLASAATPQDLTHRILVRATDAVDADRATLLRLDADDLVVDDAFDREGRPGFAGLRTPVREHPMMVRALTTRRTEQVPGQPLEGVPEIREGLEGTVHSIVAPLLLGGEAVGFLNLHRRRDETFSESDLMTAQLISNVAVLALRNARLYADAQAAKEAMGELLDIVVHDLRAPLTVVGGYCSMMRDGVFGDALPAWGRPLAIVETKVREAQQLVDQLLLAERLDTGDIPAREENLDLAELVRSAVLRAEPRVQLDSASIAADPRLGSVWARGDRAHVEQIIDNLVNNALLYGGTPAQIEVTVLRGARPGIAVTDHGPGVPADKRERIFGRFFRGHEGVKGSGLGLYVSRRLAQASHGTLELDADWADGARFLLHLRAAGPGGGESSGG